jgi:hypothetical protein
MKTSTTVCMNIADSLLKAIIAESEEIFIAMQLLNKHISLARICICNNTGNIVCDVFYEVHVEAT